MSQSLEDNLQDASLAEQASVGAVLGDHLANPLAEPVPSPQNEDNTTTSPKASTPDIRADVDLSTLPLPRKDLHTSQTFTHNVPIHGTSPEAAIHVGVDEAGRGPMLGPMVYCAFSILASALPALETIPNVRDSKVLTHEQRVAVVKALSGLEGCGWCVRICGAWDLSREMVNVPKVSLNAVALEATKIVIQRVSGRDEESTKGGTQPIPVESLILDTLGPSRSHQRSIRTLFPTFPSITSEPKADSKHLVVSAASIIAKVTRDFILHSLVGDSAGSGYPADPKSKVWITSRLSEIACLAKDGSDLERPDGPGLTQWVVRIGWKNIEDAVRKKFKTMTWPPKMYLKKGASKQTSLTAFFKSSAKTTVPEVPIPGPQGKRSSDGTAADHSDPPSSKRRRTIRGSGNR